MIHAAADSAQRTAYRARINELALLLAHEEQVAFGKATPDDALAAQASTEPTKPREDLSSPPTRTDEQHMLSEAEASATSGSSESESDAESTQDQPRALEEEEQIANDHKEEDWDEDHSVASKYASCRLRTSNSISVSSAVSEILRDSTRLSSRLIEQSLEEWTFHRYLHHINQRIRHFSALPTN